MKEATIRKLFASEEDKMNHKWCNTAVATAAVLSLLAGPAMADLLVHESFNYAEDSDITGATCTATGLSGDSQVWERLSGTSVSNIVAGDLPYGELITSNNHLFTTTSGSGAISVVMDAPVIDALTPANGETTTAWMSCLVKRIQSNEIRIGLDRLTNPTDKLNYLVVQNGHWGVSGGYDNAVKVSETVTANEVYFYLVKFTFNLSGSNQTVTATGYRFSGGTLPENEASLGSGVYSEQTSTHARFPGRLTIYMPTSDYAIDEIRVGESFGDVVVPEPASLALIGVGLMLSRRRRS